MAAEQMPNASFSTTIIEKCDTGTILDVAIPSFRFGWMELFNDDNQPSTLTPRKLSSKICSPICCRMTFGGPSGCGGHMLTLNQHCNTYMESFGVVQGHFGLAVFSESSFDSVKAFFFSRKIGYEALFSVPKKHLVDSGAKLNALLSQMAAQGVPAEATFHELKSGDTFNIPTKFVLFLYYKLDITTYHRCAYSIAKLQKNGIYDVGICAVVMTKAVEAQSTKFIPFGPFIRHHNVEIPQHVWRLCDSKELVDGFANGVILNKGSRQHIFIKITVDSIQDDIDPEDCITFSSLSTIRESFGMDFAVPFVQKAKKKPPPSTKLLTVKLKRCRGGYRAIEEKMYAAGESCQGGYRVVQEKGYAVVDTSSSSVFEAEKCAVGPKHTTKRKLAQHVNSFIKQRKKVYHPKINSFLSLHHGAYEGLL